MPLKRKTLSPAFHSSGERPALHIRCPTDVQALPYKTYHRRKFPYTSSTVSVGELCRSSSANFVIFERSTAERLATSTDEVLAREKWESCLVSEKDIRRLCGLCSKLDSLREIEVGICINGRTITRAATQKRFLNGYACLSKFVLLLRSLAAFAPEKNQI